MSFFTGIKSLSLSSSIYLCCHGLTPSNQNNSKSLNWSEFKPRSDINSYSSTFFNKSFLEIFDEEKYFDSVISSAAFLLASIILGETFCIPSLLLFLSTPIIFYRQVL